MAYVYLAIMIVLTVAAQLLIKQGAGLLPINKFADVFSPKGLCLGAGLGLVMLAPAFYMLSLKTLPLGEAFAFTSLNYILVMLAGKYYLKETVGTKQLLGGALIVGGVVLVGIG